MDTNNLLTFIPGYLQGFVKITLSYPFDAIKVNLQKGIHKNTFESFCDILKNDPKKFYRGSMSAYIIIPLERAIYYRYAEQVNKKYNGFLTGLVMGAISSTYYTPIQYITSNSVILDKSAYKNTSFGSPIKTLRKVPIRDLYKGFHVEFVRSSIATSLFLGSYLHIRSKYENTTKISPFLGPITSIFSWFVVYPLDTIRTEKQTSTLTVGEIVKQKMSQGGIKAFYRGITPIVLRTIPSTSLGMYLYEYSRTKIK